MQDAKREQIKLWLKSNKDITRQHVADECGVAKSTVDQWLSKKEIPVAQVAIIDRMMAKNSHLDVSNRISLEFTDDQFDTISKAASIVGTPLRDFMVNSVIARARQDMKSKYVGSIPSVSMIHRQENSTLPENIIELPYLGAVAAGEPVSAPLNDTLPVSKEYPEKHFIVEVNGRSAEPDFPDGSRWVVDGRDKYTPKNGAVCVVSDEYGSYIKRWNGKKNIYESINPEFNDVMPGESAKLQGYPVEMVE